jgi:signal transduction histidine kinase
MFVLLGILVWLNEILDIPRLLGAPHTPINWREAIVETVVIVGVGLFVVSRLISDMTERRRAEEALKEYSERLEEMVEERTRALRDAQEQLIRREKLAVLGQLAGGVGHELRNPLGVISNAVYFLQMTLADADEATREYLDIISSEVRGAEKIVSDLLDYSRTRPAEREEIAISNLVSQVLERRPPSEDVEVVTQIPSDLPPVFVDPRQIGQVLGNLVTNAYQAMPDGGRLMISVSEDEGIGRRGDTGTRRQGDSPPVSPSPCLRVSISDTGCGIPPESLEKIFEPLFTTKAKGIGLGLAVSKNLVEANGGSIEVESPSTGLRTGEEGKGSTFTVKLPSTVAAEFPDLNFAIIDTVAEGDNVASIVYREQEGGFLGSAR